MAAIRKVVELPIGERELAELQSIARSRTAAASRVLRARILLHYRDDSSCYAVGRAVGVTHQTVQRCLARASRFGVMAALDDRPRPGKEPEITVPARAWLVSLACQKAKQVGYPHELWTTRLLARHCREHGPAAGHASLARIAQGTVCKLLAEQEVKPHKVRYYLERRDPEFEAKMAEVLCVYQEVAILRAAESNAHQVAPEAEAAAAEQSAPNVAFVSYDEKPGIQAIANTAPDLPPVAGKHACVARDHEYRRHGTLSLLAGIDLLTGQVHACVEDRHRSREFIGFLKRLDAAYPADTAIKLILDNHSAHVSKETKKWLATQREGRFSLVFTPKHGSWLNLVEGFFSKMARSVLRHIRVASKAELKQRIMAYLDNLNRQPVVHTWSYKITLPA
jgi:transposase